MEVLNSFEPLLLLLLLFLLLCGNVCFKRNESAMWPHREAAWAEEKNGEKSVRRPRDNQCAIAPAHHA